MQDQMRFEKDGKWIDFTPDFPSNHKGTVKEHGKWVVPVFPSNRSIQGSVPTPYIFDDRCTAEDAAIAIEQMYNFTAEERQDMGQAGYDWVTGDEANMTATKMANRVIEVLDEGFEKFTPRSSFDFYKIQERTSKYIPHKLTGY